MSRAPALAALTAIGLGLGACSPSAEHGANEVADDAVPFALLDDDAPALIPQAGGTSATLCLVRGDRVVPVTRSLPGDPEPTDLVVSLADDVADIEASQGLRTALISTRVREVSVRGGTALVELTGLPEGGSQEPMLAVAQIVCTLTSQPGIGQVQFSVANAPVQVPRPDGSLADGTVTRDDYADVLGP